MRVWYIPLNKSVMDFVLCLHHNDTIDIRMYGSFKFAVGDTVFIYSGKPYHQFLYQMEIIKTDIPFAKAELHQELRTTEQTPTINDWMRLKVVKSVPHNTASLTSAAFNSFEFWFLKHPQLIKIPEMLDYIYDEFEKNNCE